MDSQNFDNATDFFDNKEITKTIYVNNISQDKNNLKNSNNDIQNSIVYDSFMKSMFNKSEINDDPEYFSFKPAEEDKNNKIDFPNNPNVALNREENLKQVEDNYYIQKIIADLDDADEKLKLESFKNNELKSNGIISLLNKLLKENKELKTDLKQAQSETNKQFIINPHEAFNFQNKINDDSNREKSNFNHDNKSNLNDKSVNESYQNKSNLFNINEIGNKFNAQKENGNENSTESLNKQMKSAKIDGFEFNLCDNFLQTKQFIYENNENAIILRIYNKSKKPFEGKVRINIENLNEIKSKAHNFLIIESPHEKLLIREKEFIDFRIIIKTSSEDLDLELKFSCDFTTNDKNTFNRKFSYTVLTSNIANELNADIYFSGTCLEITDEAKLFFYLILKNGKIFMEKDEYISFLNSYDFDSQKITDILM